MFSYVPAYMYIYTHIGFYRVSDNLLKNIKMSLGAKEVIFCFIFWWGGASKIVILLPGLPGADLL